LSYFKVPALSRHLPGGKEENYENLSQDSLSAERDLNPDLPNTSQECFMELVKSLIMNVIMADVHYLMYKYSCAQSSPEQGFAQNNSTKFVHMYASLSTGIFGTKNF
jgi:hypothetical protein